MQRYTSTPFAALILFFDLLQTLLVVRFFLKFFGANAYHWLVQLFYEITESLVSPFRTVFPDARIGMFHVEWATLLAMMAYGLVAFLLIRILTFGLHSWDDAFVGHGHRHA